MDALKSYEDLAAENERLRLQLEEADEMIEAIRTGQIDALVVQGQKGHELYTLKTADQTYRVFIEKMTEGAVTLNAEGLILYSNSRFAEMLGRPLPQVTGMPFQTFVTAAYRDTLAGLMQKGWQAESKGEVLLDNSDGPVPVLLSLTTLQLDEGISLSIILTDLTEQKEAERQLKENYEQLAKANEALELSNTDLLQFASVASHDLQEPLRKIQYFSHLLRDKYGATLPDGFDGYLDKIIASSTRMRTLILDILNYSRLSEQVLHFEPVDLKQLVTELIDDFEILIRDKHAVITLGDLPVVEVNRGQMRQVFQNLISNALKFSRDGEPPAISITCELSRSAERPGATTRRSDYCRICVRDNGIGFNERYVSDIFSLFKRLHSRDQFEGTGIGLAITKKIMDKHHGRILVRSEEGTGSAFTLVLPMKQGT